MMIELTPQQKIWQQKARQFAREKVAPRADEIDRSNDFPWDIYKEMQEAGLSALLIPPKYGGAGEGLLTWVLVLEELAKVSGSVAMMACNTCFGGLMYDRFGSQEQKDRYIPQFMAGKL